MKKFDWRGRQRRTRPDTRPCAACGLAPRIRLHNHLGRYCLYFGTRIPEDEARELNDLRKFCIEDGNHCVRPVHRYSAKDLLAWRMTMADWHRKRWILKVAVIVASASLAPAPFGLLSGPLV